MKSVNFLSKINQQLSDQQKKDRKIFKICLIVFIAVMVVLVLTFSTSFYLQYRLKSVKAQVEQAEAEIDSKKELETDYLSFVNKLIIIRELFDQRTDKQIAMGYFADLFGPDVEISGLNYDMETGILSLNITSPHVFYLEEVFNSLEKPAVKKHFNSIEKSNLNREESGEYTFTITVDFAEESELVTEEPEYLQE